MKTILVCLGTLVLLLSPSGTLVSAPFPSAQLKALQKRHRIEHRKNKQDQRAMRRVMVQHRVGGAANRRFQHNLKMQRQLLRKNQSQEVRRLKRS